MKNHLIITHHGGAHFDEVTAISFILATIPDTNFTIERRQPTTIELDDPETWVVDIGLRLEPKNLNFDHHQSSSVSASFVLVAVHLGLLETMSVMPWWHFKDEVDRFGPTKSSIKYNAGDVLVNQNAVENWLLRYFAAEPNACIPILKSYGEDLLDSARLLKTQIDYWRTCTRLDIAGVPAMIGENQESAGLEEFRLLDKNPPDIVISLDHRDDGWRLFRYEGTPVDFRLIADRPEISFVHNTGFLAKTKERLDTESLISLVSGAIIRQ